MSQPKYKQWTLTAEASNAAALEESAEVRVDLVTEGRGTGRSLRIGAAEARVWARRLLAAADSADKRVAIVRQVHATRKDGA